MKQSNNKTEPFGTLLGYGPGKVPAYSSDYDSVDPNEHPNRHSFRHYVNGIYTGYKWQCVEYARRWLLINKGYVFDDIAMAYDIFRLTKVRHIELNTFLPLRSFENGAQRHPEPGCLLIWQEGGEFETTGHVAIVTAVHDHYIQVAEQNIDHKKWGENKNYSRELKTKIDENNGYWIQCSFLDGTILGWVIQTEDDAHSITFPPPNPAQYELHVDTLQAPLMTKNWLNIANPDEQAYVLANGYTLCQKPGDEHKMVLIHEQAIDEIKRATNELHALFLHATDFITQQPDLQSAFNFPKELWSKIQQSWDNRRHQLITGRFDFAMTPEGIKVYEYNCDSASCHMEAGKIQALWAKYHRVQKGDDAGEDLFEALVEAWRASEANGLIHILTDSTPEEIYHSRFMQTAMETAGLEVQIIENIQDLHKNGAHIHDKNGNPIQWIWKTWAWETALDQLRAELIAPSTSSNSPIQLKDILFHDNILCFEPLWTLIPSNKAILPILWSLFPEHSNLLQTEYTCSTTLKAKGYVKKPIVGRCGENISIINGMATMLETQGQFHAQDMIYQELFPLPFVDNKFMQICSFTVGGKYAGACTRVDPTMIVTSNSDIMPLRVIEST